MKMTYHLPPSFLFFFKQKTAYEIKESDWSSDVCSSDLMFWAERESAEPVRPVPLGKARKLRDGDDLTLVAWGNTVEKSLEALAKMDRHVNVDLFDLRSIAPWDKNAIAASVRKTGRLVIVQEDTENCSVGQMIISHLMSEAEIWNAMVSPPILVSKGNVLIGYHPIYEYAALAAVEGGLAA